MSNIAKTIDIFTTTEAIPLSANFQYRMMCTLVYSSTKSMQFQNDHKT